VAVTLTVSTSATTPVGTWPLSINAVTPGESAKTQTLTLLVGSAPDYTLSIANPSLTSSVNVPATFNGTLTAMNGYASAVALNCSPNAPPSCVVNPASALPSNTGIAFTATVSSPVSQAYNFSIVGVGSDVSTTTHSFPVSFNVLPSQSFDFTLSASPSSKSIAVGQSAIYSLDISPTTGVFPSNVGLSCSNLPPLTTCGFNPTQISSGSGDSVVTVTMSTTAPVPHIKYGMVGLFFPLLAAGLVGTPLRRRMFGAVIMLTLTFSVICCGGGLQGNGGGGGGNPGTPPGTYTVTLTATSSQVTHSTPVTLTVTQ
jgi:hypothetical protein